MNPTRETLRLFASQGDKTKITEVNSEILIKQKSFKWTPNHRALLLTHRGKLELFSACGLLFQLISFSICFVFFSFVIKFWLRFSCRGFSFWLKSCSICASWVCKISKVSGILRDRYQSGSFFFPTGGWNLRWRDMQIKRSLRNYGGHVFEREACAYKRQALALAR